MLFLEVLLQVVKLWWLPVYTWDWRLIGRGERSLPFINYFVVFFYFLKSTISPGSLNKFHNSRSYWESRRKLNKLCKTLLWQILNHWHLFVNLALNVTWSCVLPCKKCQFVASTLFKWPDCYQLHRGHGNLLVSSFVGPVTPKSPDSHNKLHDFKSCCCRET